jgi:antitoxin component YwqK of YwqJK toxin-antitoxin module
MIARLQLFNWLTTVIFAALFSVQANAGDVNKKDQTGLRQGYWIITGEMLGDRTYAAGAKVEEGYYKDDRRHGVWKKYYPTGKLRSEITYNVGRPEGPYTIYYTNGNLEEKGNWDDGKNIGEFKRFFENGKPQQQFFFDESGKRNGTQYYYHDNGNLALVVDIVNGKENGDMKRYSPEGVLLEDKEFANGDVRMVNFKSEKAIRSAGSQKTDAYNKNLGRESVVVKDKPNPASAFQPDAFNTLYDSNGNVTQSGEFKEGKLYNGKWYRYNSSGVLTKIDLYRKGRYIGEGAKGE